MAAKVYFQKKKYNREIYEDLLEDSMELSEETKEHIRQAEDDLKHGRIVSFEDVKKKLGIKY